MEEAVLDHVAEEPSISTQSVAHEMGVAHCTVWKATRELQMHPYYPQKGHALTPADFAPHVAFSQWLLQHYMVDPNFPAYILFTNEACFTRYGKLNSTVRIVIYRQIRIPTLQL